MRRVICNHRSVAERIASNLRGVDLLARIGGEEFLAVLPDCSAKMRRARPNLRATVAARLCRWVEMLKAHLLVKQTVSIGVVAVTMATRML